MTDTASQVATMAGQSAAPETERPAGRRLRVFAIVLALIGLGVTGWHIARVVMLPSHVFASVLGSVWTPSVQIGFRMAPSGDAVEAVFAPIDAPNPGFVAVRYPMPASIDGAKAVRDRVYAAAKTINLVLADFPAGSCSRIADPCRPLAAGDWDPADLFMAAVGGLLRMYVGGIAIPGLMLAFGALAALFGISRRAVLTGVGAMAFSTIAALGSEFAFATFYGWPL
ncbi:MAG: hypothetical protein F8N36_14120 [Desulfovibrio sp.]|uniref:hypothetical protein n=1 Tax=Desulfovibrio sp. TaxID=885 RepID=UPI00135EE788|nr:hypothetical protein [Desulfovibrio sp.]MTJ93975.1 hypothetical protein [Desulfovibrio sp.]